MLLIKLLERIGYQVVIMFSRNIKKISDINCVSLCWIDIRVLCSGF